MGMTNPDLQKLTPRNQTEIAALTARLNRIIGQINGIKKMLSENKYCREVLQQVAAAEKALKSFAYLLLADHFNGCVSDKIRAYDQNVVNETLDLIRKIN